MEGESEIEGFVVGWSGFLCGLFYWRKREYLKEKDDY